LSTRNERAARAYVRFIQQHGRPPLAIVRGQEGEGWEDPVRRAEHDVSVRGQNAAVLVAKAMVLVWAKRTAGDWLSGLASSQGVEAADVVTVLEEELDLEEEKVCNLLATALYENHAFMDSTGYRDPAGLRNVP
jgi:hypothetical protein